jgi:hypothetical protein
VCYLQSQPQSLHGRHCTTIMHLYGTYQDISAKFSEFYITDTGWKS